MHKINKLYLATSRFSLWESMSNWFTWRFGQKAFHERDLSIVHWGNRVCCGGGAPTWYQSSPY